MTKFPLALIILMSLLLRPVTAQDDVTAINVSAISDYKAAIQHLEMLAERGDARAAYKMGLIYNDGEVRKQDFMLAVSWFSRSAAQES